MRTTALSFPHSAIPKETLEVWAQDWEKLADTYGPDLLADAARRHGATEKFFPIPAELLGCIRLLITEKREAQRRGSAKFQACSEELHGGVFHGGTQCIGGMVVFTAANGHRYAKECHCLKAWRDQQAVAGAKTA